MTKRMSQSHPMRAAHQQSPPHHRCSGNRSTSIRTPPSTCIPKSTSTSTSTSTTTSTSTSAPTSVFQTKPAHAPSSIKRMSQKDFLSAIKNEFRKSGIEQKIRTQLRKEVVSLVLEDDNDYRSYPEEHAHTHEHADGRGHDHSNIQSKISFFPTRRSVDLEHTAVRSIVMEYLELDGLHSSLSVYASESGLGDEGHFLSRRDILRALDLPLSNEYENLQMPDDRSHSVGWKSSVLHHLITK